MPLVVSTLPNNNRMTGCTNRPNHFSVELFGPTLCKSSCYRLGCRADHASMHMLTSCADDGRVYQTCQWVPKSQACRAQKVMQQGGKTWQHKKSSEVRAWRADLGKQEGIKAINVAPRHQVLLTFTNASAYARCARSPNQAL